MKSTLTSNTIRKEVYGGTIVQLINIFSNSVFSLASINITCVLVYCNVP